ncbi:hypothetical protein MTR67_028612, partial [Solanum verrucosum]
KYLFYTKGTCYLTPFITFSLQAARILANIIIMGSGIMARAFAQAYRQALTREKKIWQFSMALAFEMETRFYLRRSVNVNLGHVMLHKTLLIPASYSSPRLENNDASKNGVAQEAVQNIRRASKTMTEVEARQVLGVAEHSSWEDVLQKYDNLFESNAKNGSFYLQSKVHRAKECLESLYQSKAEGPN